MAIQRIDNSNAVYVERGVKRHPAGPKANTRPGLLRRVLGRWEDLPVDENGSPIAGQDALDSALTDSGWKKR
jgi:hypothetical protein